MGIATMGTFNLDDDDVGVKLDEITWTLPPVDRLSLDSDERWLAEALRASAERLRALTTTCNQYRVRLRALLVELRTAQDEIRTLRARVRLLEDRAA